MPPRVDRGLLRSRCATPLREVSMTANDLPPAPEAVDRSAAERGAEGLLDALRRDPSTRVLAVHGDAAPLAAYDRLRLVGAEELADASPAEWAFLGRAPGGAAILAAVFDPEFERPVLSETIGWDPARGGRRPRRGPRGAPRRGGEPRAVAHGRSLLPRVRDARRRGRRGVVATVSALRSTALPPDGSRRHRRGRERGRRAAAARLERDVG